MAVLPRVPFLALAPRLRKLDHAIPIEAAIVLAVEDGAILADVRGGALAGAEPVAHALGGPREDHELLVLEPARDLSAVRVVVTAVRAMLGSIAVVLAHGAGTRDV